MEKEIRQEFYCRCSSNGSKAFDCIPHGLTIAKLAAYGIEIEALRLIYCYLKSRKQCVKINNTYSGYNEIISGVPFLYRDSLYA